MKKLAARIASLLPFVLTGCVSPAGGGEDGSPGESEEDLAEVYQAGSGGNPNGGTNHFSGSEILAPDARAAYPLLAPAPLVDGDGFLAHIAVHPAYRKNVIQNLVECALGVEQTVIDHETGVAFRGHWGLAMDWVREPLAQEQQRWVTGCMLQRLNAWGHEVPILLVGKTASIFFDEDETKNYPFDESTAWGNLFASSAGGIFVCSSDDLSVRCDLEGKSPYDWLHERICDGLADCGMVYRGRCSSPSVCTPTSYPNGVYPTCYGPEGNAYKETVHVQLQSTNATCTPAP